MAAGREGVEITGRSPPRFPTTMDGVRSPSINREPDLTPSNASVGRDAGSLRRPGSLSLRGDGTSVSATERGVGLGVAVAEDLEEVDEVGLLRGRQAQVAHLAV
jgi:hypothetical protein